MPTSEERDDVTAYRLARVEQAVLELRKEMQAEFTGVQTSIANLAFVSKEVYVSERQAMQKEIAEAHRLAQWAVGLVASTTVGAIVVAIIGMSGVFGP